jgi:hypothetical protein
MRGVGVWTLNACPLIGMLRPEGGMCALSNDVGTSHLLARQTGSAIPRRVRLNRFSSGVGGTTVSERLL